MAKFCTECGTALQPDAKACSNCGYPVPGAESEAEPITESISEPAEDKVEELRIQEDISVLDSEEPAEVLTEPEASYQEPVSLTEDTVFTPGPEYTIPDDTEVKEQPKAEPIADTAAMPGAAEEASKEKHGVTKTAGYFWYLLLFSVPVIGLFASLLFTLFCKKPSTKNFAKAVMLWHIIVMSVLIVCAVIALIVIVVKDLDIKELIIDFLRELQRELR